MVSQVVRELRASLAISGPPPVQHVFLMPQVLDRSSVRPLRRGQLTHAHSDLRVGDDQQRWAFGNANTYRASKASRSYVARGPLTSFGPLLVTDASSSFMRPSTARGKPPSNRTAETGQSRIQETTLWTPIQSSEKRQPFGTRAKQFTSELAFGKTVTVVPMGRDRYGRWPMSTCPTTGY
jgi:hypothetical protein